jgi:hypothetical protein
MEFTTTLITVTDVTNCSSVADIVISEKNTPNHCSNIEVKNGRSALIIELNWFKYSNSSEPSIYWSEEEKTLFLGVGCISAVINANTKQVININYPELFWDWESVSGHILELGELECRLYSLSGELIGQAPVDPPYDYTVTENGIHFSSIVMGRTSIEWSKR